MFYAAQFDEVYYSQALDCFAVMESEDGAYAKRRCKRAICAA